jgi:hypothetical protein
LLVALLAPLANVRVALGQDAVSRISSPQSGSTVRDVVVVTGTATHPSFSFYKVELSLEPGGTWFVIGDTHANQVKDGALLQWDTRTVPDGSYSLRLLVVDATGNYIESVVRQVVVANAGAAPTETTTPTPTGTLTGTPATGTPTVTPPSGTPEPTATVSIILPSVDTATPIAVGTRVAVAVPTGEATASEDTSTGTAIREMLSGIAGEMLDALGIHIDTQSLGSAGVRGAVLAFGAFLAIGVLALVRAVLVGLFHLIFRR